MLYRLSEETHGKIDSLLFEKDRDLILAGLMIKINDTVFTGTALKLKFVWLLADTLNAMMAIPNLIGLLLLSPVVFKVTKEYKFNNSK